MIDWKTELPKIVATAGDYRLDPMFIAAIRHTENGAPGKEFGVLSIEAPTYDDQLDECCASVAHRLEQFAHNPLYRFFIGEHSTIRYTFEFVHWFASIWAPGGASNDPHGLNANWVLNCWTTYVEYIKNGVS